MRGLQLPLEALIQCLYFLGRFSNKCRTLFVSYNFTELYNLSKIYHYLIVSTDITSLASGTYFISSTYFLYSFQDFCTIETSFYLYFLCSQGPKSVVTSWITESLVLMHFGRLIFTRILSTDLCSKDLLYYL